MSSHPSLSASARSTALQFVVAGKSPSQLEAWLRSYAPVEWARLKGSSDRYPLMRAVETRIEELREEEEKAGAGAEEEEEADGEDKPRSTRAHRASATAAAAGGKKKAASSAAAAAAAPATASTTATKRKVRERDAQRTTRACLRF